MYFYYYIHEILGICFGLLLSALFDDVYALLLTVSVL